ncbi:hypothetical protein LZ31DRAFT_89172 [Colletotrichum somersetense]|nr:hypothetical protein LZ31DRAFT_89172 [Colletotrichum somersetense]
MRFHRCRGFPGLLPGLPQRWRAFAESPSYTQCSFISPANFPRRHWHSYLASRSQIAGWDGAVDASAGTPAPVSGKPLSSAVANILTNPNNLGAGTRKEASGSRFSFPLGYLRNRLAGSPRWAAVSSLIQVHCLHWRGRGGQRASARGRKPDSVPGEEPGRPKMWWMRRRNSPPIKSFAHLRPVVSTILPAPHASGERWHAVPDKCVQMKPRDASGS